VLQCVAVCYRVFGVMQCIPASNSFIPPCVAVCCSVLQRAAEYYSVVQCFFRVLKCAQREPDAATVDICVAACCNELQCVAVCRSVLQCAAVWCSMLQCGAVCCIMVQFVTVWCSVCVAV